MLAVPSTPVVDFVEFYIPLTPVQQITDDVSGGFAMRSIMTERTTLLGEDAVHDLKGEASRHRAWPTRHFHSNLYCLKNLGFCSARSCRLLDMPLHAGLAVGGERDPDGDELLVLLGEGAIREGSASLALESSNARCCTDQETASDSFDQCAEARGGCLCSATRDASVHRENR